MKAILVIEDEPCVMGVLRYVLRKHNVIEASTAEEALKCYLEVGRRVEVVLSDVILPRLSGIQIALLLRFDRPDLPIVLTSGYPVSMWSERDTADLYKLGRNNVTILQKPFKPETVLAAVDNAIPTTRE